MSLSPDDDVTESPNTASLELGGGLTWAILAQYVMGDASREQRECVDRWAGADPENRVVLDRLLNAWQSELQAEPWNPSVDAMRQAVMEQVRPHAPITREHSSARPFRHPIQPTISRFARVRSIALGVGICVVALAAAWEFHDSAAPAQAVTHYATAARERARIDLADGSSVVLAPDSYLEIPKGFGNSVRDVRLEGEAVFTVTRTSRVPFVVHAGNVSARVLGTTFGVRKYESDSVVRIAVAEGRIAIGPEKVLVAGDVVTGRSSKDMIVRQQRDVTGFFAWTSGRITFQNAPAAEVVDVLSRWYGIDITLGDESLERDSLTATLQDASTDEMLRTLAIGLNARIDRVANRVTLHRDCGTARNPCQ